MYLNECVYALVLPCQSRLRPVRLDLCLQARSVPQALSPSHYLMLN